LAKNPEKCSQEVVDFCTTVLYSSHPRLTDAKVTIEYLFVNDLQLHGYSAAGVVKILSEEHRAAGSADARILLDSEWWNDATEEERRALIDHELTHLLPQFKRKKKGDSGPEVFKTDNLGRPVLKMRLHDWENGGFWSNIETHQENSPDFQAIIAVNKTLKEKKILSQTKMWG
jgi:hypothetical protein